MSAHFGDLVSGCTTGLDIPVSGSALCAFIMILLIMIIAAVASRNDPRLRCRAVHPQAKIGNTSASNLLRRDCSDSTLVVSAGLIAQNFARAAVALCLTGSFLPPLKRRPKKSTHASGLISRLPMCSGLVGVELHNLTFSACARNLFVRMLPEFPCTGPECRPRVPSD